MKTFDNKWEEVHSTHDWGKYPLEEVVRFVARNFFKRERSATHLLDLGCGSGAHTWFLAREGFQVHALDASKEAIRKAEMRLTQEGFTARFALADAGELPYHTASFDGIIDSAMISANALPGIRQILRECFRVLKPGGRHFSSGLFQVGMSGYGTGAPVEEHTFRNLTDGPLANIGTIHFFDEPEVRSLFEAAGFRNLKVDFLHRSDRGGAYEVRYFFVEAEKPSTT